MYNFIMYAMQLGVRIAARFDSKVRKMWRGEQAAFGVLQQRIDPTARYVWFHAASLGEFEQGRPLMEAIRREFPDYKILLTFFSPSGYEVRHLPPDRHRRQRAPLPSHGTPCHGLFREV